MGVILETNQLCKFYGTGENQVKAVNHVNIQIQQGEFVAIVGKSGSGKSTLLHMLGGLDTPTSGSVILSDKNLYSMKEDQLAVFRRRKIGFVFQAFNLVSSINVWENIVLPLGLDGKKVDKAYVNDIITTLGLEHRIHNLPNIRVSRYITAVYTIAGICSAIAGIISVSRTGIGTPQVGSGIETDAIAACVIGGANMMGGEGSVLKTVVGVFVLALIRNIMNLLAIPSYPQDIIKGAVIILAVLLQTVTSRKS